MTKHFFQHTMVAPKININGTSAQELIENHLEARDAVEAAITALRKANPHPRDYQGEPDSYKFAREAYHARLGALQELVSDLYGIAINIDHQTEN